MSKKLIVFTQSGGRFGNQMLLFIHLYSFWKENQNKINFITISLWPYLHLLEFTGPKKYGYFNTENKHSLIFKSLFFIYSHLPNNQKSKFHSLITIGIHFMGYVMPNMKSIFSKKNSLWSYIRKYCIGKEYDQLNLVDSDTMKLLINYHCVIAGFVGPKNELINCWDLVKKYQKDFIKNFTFNNKFYKMSEPFFDKMKYSKIKVGVHIRHGDYSLLVNGQLGKKKVFFSIDFYIKKIVEIKRLLGEETLFIITSDSDLDTTKLKSINYILSTGSKSEGGHYIESIIQLSKCDFLLMPYTSFAGFVSFISNSPVFLIESEDTQFNSVTTTQFQDIFAES